MRPVDVVREYLAALDAMIGATRVRPSSPGEDLTAAEARYWEALAALRRLVPSRPPRR